MFYWIKTNSLIKWLFRNQFWFIPNAENCIYLTFDDGPTPDVTPWVLDVLKQENIKATFFCIGKNIQKHPDIFKRILAEGHTVGNHTFNHQNGWLTNFDVYIEDITNCQVQIQSHIDDVTNSEIKISNSKIFRPPYGKITPKQSKFLRSQGYKIIMWDVLTADFDTKITQQQCLKNATEKVASGSVIVFHDSVKAAMNLQYALPKAIRIYKEKGYKFDFIS